MIENTQYTNLNNEMTFENFVIGDSNRFAFSSCLAVAQNPGKLYNPLFLYGKSGLGKTHLMHAIGNYIHNNSNLKVLYITTDEFMNEFINITKDSGNKEENLSYIDLFKSKYRDIDVLMIDDIQFLVGATNTQQEFINIFNNLYNNDKQIVICSNKSVDDLKIDDKLKTRLNCGFRIAIEIPTSELKVNIIKNKSKDLILNLSNDIINYIAINCEDDIRILEGAITRIAAYSTIHSITELNLDNVKEALKEYFKDEVCIEELTIIDKDDPFLFKYIDLDKTTATSLVDKHIYFYWKNNNIVVSTEGKVLDYKDNHFIIHINDIIDETAPNNLIEEKRIEEIDIKDISNVVVFNEYNNKFLELEFLNILENDMKEENNKKYICELTDMNDNKVRVIVYDSDGLKLYFGYKHKVNDEKLIDKYEYPLYLLKDIKVIENYEM